MINFCYDDLGDFGIGYPNLARRDVEPWQFDDTWPRTVPLRLLLYLQAQGINNQAHVVDQAPTGAWYPVAWAWHDFSCDYIGLMSESTRAKLRDRSIRALFYYHEGDDPKQIVQHLRARCDQHQVPNDCFLLVSANTAADSMPGACYFPDHEYFFRWLNRAQSAVPVTGQQRPYRFTALNRLHKSWRGMIMADLHAQGMLDQSLWSYNTDLTMEDSVSEHPLDVASIKGWANITRSFLEAGPYVCDSSDSDAHNDHSLVNTKLYSDSACHIVFETLLDADGSGGSFLTEKTYKCIKYGQPFVIIGTAGSLAQLQRDGYRTFDRAIDPTYDTITNSTDRYMAIRAVLKDLACVPTDQLMSACRADLEHNQRIFLDLQSHGLNRLVERLT